MADLRGAKRRDDVSLLGVGIAARRGLLRRPSPQAFPHPSDRFGDRPLPARAEGACIHGLLSSLVTRGQPAAFGFCRWNRQGLAHHWYRWCRRW